MAMITRRDLAIAAGAAALTLAAVAVAQTPKPALIGPSVWRWEDIKPHDTDVGAYAQLAKGPTATLDELEMHVTTLKPGLSSRGLSRDQLEDGQGALTPTQSAHPRESGDPS